MTTVVVEPTIEQSAATPRVSPGTALGVIIVLTTATQLRSVGPLGLGEVSLLGWIGILGMRMTTTPRIDTGKRQPMLGFWAVVMPVLLVAPVWALAINKLSTEWMRDLIAMSLMAAMCFVATVALSPEQRERAASVYAVGVVFAFTLLRWIPFVGAGLGVNIWYADRFQAWTTNPNQVAIQVVWVPFFLVRQIVKRREGRAVAIVALALSILIGLDTHSDSLKLGWMTGLAVIPFLAAARSDRPRVRQVTLGVMALALGFAIYRIDTVIDAVGSYGDSLRFQQGTDDGGGRGRLQTHAIEAWARSPIIGLGPGLYTGLERPFTNEEAHNATLDLAMKSGMVGIGAWVVLGVAVFRRVKADSLVAVGAFVAVAAFTTGHNLLRHPSFWLLATLFAAWDLPPPPGNDEDDELLAAARVR